MPRTVWKTLIRLGNRHRAALPPAPDPLEQLIARTPELRTLLEGLGYNPRFESESIRLLGELKSSIRAEIADYTAFRMALAKAILQSKNTHGGPFALLDTLDRAADLDATLAILNADPIHGQVPYIEQIPVVKAGQLAWRSPVQHTLIRRWPLDVPAFQGKIGELEILFSVPYPPRSEGARRDVLDAIARVRRELDRNQASLPAPMLHLETKLQEYQTKSLRRDSAELIHALLRMIERLEALRWALDSPDSGATSELIGQVAEQAALYLDRSGIQVPWLTNRILGLSLDSRFTSPARKRLGKRNREKMDSIRREIATGHYDAAETARRLHEMESCGFDVISLVYPLLKLNARGEG